MQEYASQGNSEFGDSMHSPSFRQGFGKQGPGKSPKVVVIVVVGSFVVPVVLVEK